MSTWRDRRFFEPSVKQPPPAHGIRMNKAGTTWWGQRWIAALEQVLSGDAGRLARGRTYARAGRTHDLVIANGSVRAKVTGSRPQPYDVALKIQVLSPGVWSQALAAMGERAQFAAELLAGRMPEKIDEVFRSAKSSLFPQRRSELSATCSCPDWGDPCKHVAATHYLLGEAFDRDPFLLFELRGRSKEQVLGALRSARSGESDESDALAPAPDAKIPTVTFEGIDAAAYDRAPEPVPALSFSFAEQAAHGALLRQLGAPAAWTARAAPAEALTPIVRAAAARARILASAESASADSVVTARPPNPEPLPVPEKTPRAARRPKAKAPKKAAKKTAKRRSLKNR
jgi:uncharacterized Zn finger protein